MTYKDLLNVLNSLPPERLNDTVTVSDPYEDEFIPVVHTVIATDENTGVLDVGHLFLVLKA